MFKTRWAISYRLYVLYSFTIVGNKFINMDCKIANGAKKRGHFRP